MPNWCPRFSVSKAAVIILLWNTIVGATYGIVLNGALAASFAIVTKGGSFHAALYGFLGLYMGISLIQVFLYPVAGLMADIWYGRYKVITVSTVKLWCGYFFLVVLLFLLAFAKHKKFDLSVQNGKVYADFQFLTIGVVLILFTVGFTGFQANVVQFGLDQFLDAPSEKLSSFLHWLVWTDVVGQTAMRIMTSLVPCIQGQPNVMVKIIACTPVFICVVLTVLIILSCYKRHWFHSEPHTHNPYGTVYKVLKFAAKHDRPLRRSAFAYCDDEMPTRIEFAKQRFGGPFTTETVEDVRIFLRILIMLVAIGPTYIIQVSTVYNFPVYGLYTAKEGLFNSSRGVMKCGVDWVLLASGNLSFLVSVVFIPLYCIFILPRIRRYLPKILFRIGTGLILLLLADLSMTLTQLAGRYHLQNELNNNTTPCLFNANYSSGWATGGDRDSLSLPSWTFLIPNVLVGLATPITYISILEFISAQSPHSMKGLLVGVFHAVRGLFTTIGCLLVFPFANNLWEGTDGDFFGCGLSYYTVSVLMGVVGVGLFLLASRWYRYRVRGDQPYGPHYVEAYYERQQQEVASDQPTKTLANNSMLNYGTMQ